MKTCIKLERQNVSENEPRLSKLGSHYRGLVKAIQAGDLSNAQAYHECIDALHEEWQGLSLPAQRAFDDLGLSIAVDDAHNVQYSLRRFRDTLRSVIHFHERPTMIPPPAKSEQSTLFPHARTTDLAEHVEGHSPTQSGIVPRYSFDDYAVEAVGQELPSTAY